MRNWDEGKENEVSTDIVSGLPPAQFQGQWARGRGLAPRPSPNSKGRRSRNGTANAVEGQAQSQESTSEEQRTTEHRCVTSGIVHVLIVVSSRSQGPCRQKDTVESW